MLAMSDLNEFSTNMDISKLKVPDLKRELKARGLTISGNKNDLMERLQNALKSKTDLDDTASATLVDDLDDDFLNDDDLDQEQLDAASESVLKELDEHLNVPPTTKMLKRKFDEDNLTAESDLKSKKVVLNRTPSVTSESAKDDQNGVNLNAENVQDADGKKVVKLSDLSSKERLEMRAKKFGAPTSEEAKKLARAERFATGSTASAALSSSGTENANLDTLKKRAERFGGSVSKVMSGLEQQQRLEMRKARFGVVTTTNGALSQDDKAKQRLERFKTTV